jgi:hypothetical protein
LPLTQIVVLLACVLYCLFIKSSFSLSSTFSHSEIIIESNLSITGRSINIWKLCGMDMSKVDFIWASDEINKYPQKYN